jgi:aspartokinase-like uncharacterized kinase
MPADPRQPVVVKVGGSLLDLPDLAERLEGLIRQIGGGPVALVAGGGPATDIVRAWETRFGLGVTTAHWLAIRGMRLSESLLARLVPRSVIAESWNAVETAWRAEAIAILALEPMLRESESAGASTPPHSWDVTSDSLAAWGAAKLGARLILAKSVDVPAATAEGAAADGSVDRWFPQAARGGRVDWTNLRAERVRIEPWLV